MAAVSVPLSIALLVGWIWVVVQNLSLTQNVAQNTLLMVLGGLFFVVIMGVLITFSVFLAREIQEVRRQDRFIDAVSHELKSPLASLKLCLDTLGRDGLAGPQREELRQMMFDDVDRLNSFIDDVLHASRLAAERVPMSVANVNLHGVVVSCVEAVVSRHRVAHDTVRIDVDPAFIMATDPQALVVIMRNLIDNAVKYSGEPPTVFVVARVEGPDVVIEVRDNGIGIPRKDLKRVFQRFYRVVSEEVRSRKGTGLGLFVVAALARNLGGSIAADSEGPGRGTTIRLKLPVGNPAQAPSVP